MSTRSVLDLHEGVLAILRSDITNHLDPLKGTEPEPILDIIRHDHFVGDKEVNIVTINTQTLTVSFYDTDYVEVAREEPLTIIL